MTIQERFDRGAATYDRDRRRLIPCYDDFYAIPVEILPFHEDRELRVLDLGAGTGLLSAAVARRYPRALLTLVDISAEMLSHAEQRFIDDDLSRVTLQVLDYRRDTLKGVYDLVISALSIHHLPDNDKAALFQTIHGLLEPGGMFVNADQVLGENPMAEQLCRRMWLSKVKAAGIDEAALAAARERMREDRMATLAVQLQWLQQAGFVDISTWYRYYNFAIFSGSKALTPSTPARRESAGLRTGPALLA